MKHYAKNILTTHTEQCRVLLLINSNSHSLTKYNKSYTVESRTQYAISLGMKKTFSIIFIYIKSSCCALESSQNMSMVPTFRIM